MSIFNCQIPNIGFQNFMMRKSKLLASHQAAGNIENRITLDRLSNIDTYTTPSRQTPGFIYQHATAVFYAKAAWIIWAASRTAQKGTYTGKKWVQSSFSILKAFESVGGRFHFENLNVLRKLSPPCVFIGNHMSILETFILPCLVQPHFDVTFVVKQSLISYPLFKHVMLSRNPTVVGRSNPREDLRIVLEEGEKRLKAGTSIFVFPQTTRTLDFDLKKFNTLGIKLAKRGSAPAIPLALKTDAWGLGRKYKDFGKIQPDKPVHISFGDPIRIAGSGKQEHQQVIDFITSKLASWESDRPL
jgi:1-acyl-sn-glycerol-3-phosphate acyltransferase